MGANRRKHCGSGHDETTQRCGAAVDMHEMFRACDRQCGVKEPGDSANASLDGGYDHGRGDAYCQDEEWS